MNTALEIALLKDIVSPTKVGLDTSIVVTNLNLRENQRAFATITTTDSAGNVYGICSSGDDRS